MSTIFTLLMVLIVITSILLIIVVMAQNPKGGGLSSAFGGTSSAQFGVQRTNDFMENATWILGITIGVLCLLSVILTAKPIQTVQAPAQPVSQSAPSQNQETKQQNTSDSNETAPVDSKSNTTTPEEAK